MVLRTMMSIDLNLTYSCQCRNSVVLLSPSTYLLRENVYVVIFQITQRRETKYRVGRGPKPRIREYNLRKKSKVVEICVVSFKIISLCIFVKLYSRF